MKKQLLNMALLLATAGAVKAQVSFAPAVNYSAGAIPFSIFSADFNGDGKMDLATANYNGNNVSVLLGSGAGIFAAPVNYGVGTRPQSVFSADFNGDGNMDLVTANNGSNNVSLLLGNGTGVFAAAVNYSVGSGPQGVLSADFNGDGKMDLATANYSGNNVSVLIGSGAGTFAAAVNYAVASGPVSIFSADFNGDGKIDLATANNGSSNVSVLLGNGTGIFAAPVNYGVGSFPNSVFSADFNGDGNMDLATANNGASIVSVLLGSGIGAFATAVNYGVGSFPLSVFGADFNGDGKMDLATVNYNVNNTSVLLGSGTGTFATAINYGVGTGPRAVFSADFNGDGKMDLATANGSSNNVSVLLNNYSPPPAAALNFDGSNDFVNISNSSSFSFGTNDFTIETYAKTTSVSGVQVMIGKYDASNNYWLGVNNGKVTFSMIGGGNVNGAISIADNNWHHIAVVRQNGVVSLYIDGALDASGANAGTATINGNLTLGNFNGGYNFPGSLDEVRIWNRALCKGEILNNKNAELPSSQTGLVAYYKFNQGFDNSNNSTVTTLTDASGSVLTGTLTAGFALTGTTSNWVAPGAVTSGSLAPTYTAVSASVSSQVNVLCNGGNTGSATVTTTGGASPYTYLASTGATVSTLSNLTAGAYTYTVTDANACKAVQTLTITQPSALITNTVITNVACNGGSTGAINLTVSGGASGYTFMWNDGITTEDRTGLIAGVKTVTVTDANSCTKIQSATITEPTAISTSTVITNVACNGGSTGAINLTVSGGASGYTFMWNDGATTEDRTGLVAGVKTVTVTDANSCTKIQSATITEPTAINLTASASNSTICSGSSSTITANATGGTGTLTYSWVAGPTASVSVVSPTSTTVYTVNVTDDNSCVKSSTISIVANVCAPAEALNFDGANDRVDIGSSLNTILNSSNKITVEAWVNPSTNAGLGCIVGNYNTNIGDMQFLLRRDGSTYGFYVDNGGGFTAVNSVATATLGVWQHVAASWDGTVLKIYVNGVLSNTKPLTGSNIRNTINPIWIGANQIGENFNGSIDEVRIWNRTLCQPEIANNMSGEIAAILPNLIGNFHFNQGIDAATNTTVTTLTDASASALTGTLTNMALTGSTSNWIAPGGVISGNLVTAFASPTIAIIGASAICNGASTTFTASGNINTYTWTPGPPTVTITVNPNVTTTYSVIGTSTNGCVSNMATKTLTVNSLPIVTVNNGAICSGESFTMMPMGASTYTFSNGSDVVTPTSNNSYTVTGTDANGCVSAIPAVSSVTVNPIPVIIANSGNVTTCGDVSADFGIVATGNNNTYEWHYDLVGGSDHGVIDGSYTEINFDTDTMTVQQVLTGNYNNYYVYCYVTNEFGCTTRSANDTIIANPTPTITVNSGTICAGQSFTMVPSGADTYTYSSGSDVVSPSANATYTVTGTDATTGCENKATSIVTVNALPTLSVITTNTLLCTGETATLSVSGASTYTWSTTETTVDIAVTPSVQTTYTVEGTDSNGCSNTTTITQDVSLCTGVTSLTNDGSINVYPNPTKGMFVVELTSASNVTVMNALGQVIVSETFEAGKHTVNINNESTGVYFVKVTTNNKQQIIKVIKD